MLIDGTAVRSASAEVRERIAPEHRGANRLRRARWYGSADQRRVRHPRDASDAVGGLPVDRRTLRTRVAARPQVHACEQHLARLHAHVHRAHPLQTSDEQTGANQQEHRECRLCNEQCGAQMCAAGAALPSPALQRLHHIGAGGLKRRRQPREQDSQ